MAKRDVLSKILAVGGTVLVWIPILTTVFFSAVGSLRSGIFRFDYLMPAELFPVALVGGLLLLWAALRARSRRGLIGWGFGSGVGLLLAGEVLAIATGIASDETEPAGWILGLVIGSIIIYALALVVVGVAGILLARDLLRHTEIGGGPLAPASPK